MYCFKCGCKLIEKECGIDGLIPYCPDCKQFRFPTFSCGISAICLSPDKDKILLIQQYGRCDNILVAGYVMKGEDLIETLKREVKEETGLTVKEYYFNDSKYYEKSNTLMNNFVVICDKEDFSLTDEVDKAQWFSLEDAKKNIKPDSLAKYFLLQGFENIIDKLK